MTHRRDELWIQMKFYKKYSFSTAHYGQNVILFLTYHHYRSASQCFFECECHLSGLISLHVKTDGTEWVSRVGIISLQLKACFILRDRTKRTWHGWPTVKHFHDYNDNYYKRLGFRNDPARYATPFLEYENRIFKYCRRQRHK